MHNLLHQPTHDNNNSKSSTYFQFIIRSFLCTTYMIHAFTDVKLARLVHDSKHGLQYRSFHFPRSESVQVYTSSKDLTRPSGRDPFWDLTECSDQRSVRKREEVQPEPDLPRPSTTLPPPICRLRTIAFGRSKRSSDRI